MAKHNEAFSLIQNQFNKDKASKVKCTLTGHEMKACVTVMQQHLQSKKYLKLKDRMDLTNQTKAEYSTYLIPSHRSKSHVFCSLTKKLLNANPHEIKRHVEGRKFQRKLREVKSLEEKEEQEVAATNK